MTPESIIRSLDRSLAETGESIILRRPYGKGNSQRFVAVDCIAQITALRDDQISAGVTQTELNFALSPTQIEARQWPGGTIPQLPPFDIDQRIPRAQADQIVARGKVHTITFIEAKYGRGGVLVRINGRITG